MLYRVSGFYKRHTRNFTNIDYGYYIRNFIHHIASKIYPYAKVVLPNFRAAHYFYILTLVILGSILVYPVKTCAYIDVLFFTAGASTQAGLNTVNVNDLSLYQQIVLYLLATLATPIFIHGSLLFVRLYYFERHFDNIKERSLMDYRMRKSATLARLGSAPTMSSTRLNTFNNQVLGFQEREAEKGSSSSPQSSSSQTSQPVLTAYNDQGGNDIEHHSEPSDSDDDESGNGPVTFQEKIHFEEPQRPRSQRRHSRTDSGIKFSALPHPRRRKSIDPEDMYRSINMLQEHKKNQEAKSKGIQFLNIGSPVRRKSRSSNIEAFPEEDTNPLRDDEITPATNSVGTGNNDEDEDDILIIKPPIEIENSDGANPIFTKKKKLASQIQFKETPGKAKKWITTKKRKHYNPWTSKLKKTLSNSSKKGSLSVVPTDTEDDSEDEEYASIDSETSDISDNEHAADNAEGSDVDSVGSYEEDEDEDEHNSDDDDDGEGEGERRLGNGASLTKAQSHLVLPSKDETGGKKYTKRSNTLDTPQQNTSDGRKIRKKAPKRKTPRTQRNASFNQHSNVSIGDGSIENVDTNDSYQRLSRTMSGNYLSWTPTVGRNSTFIKLTDEQKEELGGIEYRAVKLLIKIIVVYYVGFNIIPGVMLLIWIYCMPHYKNLMISSSISPAWWAFFTLQSSFNDLGLTLTSNSMMSFNQNAFVQILCSFLIVIGNTGFPILLRFIIWVMFKTARPLSLYKESLGFLLDHPRRCFTLLFPSVPTWWLFFILVVLNGFDLVIFCILDLHDDTFKGVDMGYRVLNGLFQAFCTRTVGFSVMDLSQLHAATQVSYLIMMYISVLPIAISVRRTNVYEEQSLGVYAKENAEGVDESAPSNYVGSHLRNQLSYDLWYICLGLFIICIAEGKRLKEQDLRFSIFAVLFEIVSAYGTVGMSMGYPGVDCSLSGEFNVISKLVIIAMMIRGRHRGLPYTIDRAIMLPNAAMKRHDRLQEEHAINRHNTMERTTTLGRVATFGNGPIDGGNNLLTRAITNIEHRLRNRRDGRSESLTVSEDPRYVVRTVSEV